MLINKFEQEQYYSNEFKNVSKEMIPWLENLAWECRCKIEKKEWKSKYNSYVIYDYEPFCTDGFEINMLITSFDSAYLTFINYLYNEKLNTIEYLNNCYEKSPIVVKWE